MSDAHKVEALRTELAHAEAAELRSDEQVRGLASLIDKAQPPDATLSASDCHKLVSACLALNTRLREQTEYLRRAVSNATRLAKEAQRAA